MSDPDTGTYSLSANHLGVTAGGVLRMHVSPTGVGSTVPLFAPDGTAAAPSVSFLSDPDTGFYSAGANQVGIAAGGAIRQAITTSLATTYVPCALSYTSASSFCEVTASGQNTFIDFHSNASFAGSADYDCRILSVGGNGATSGGGILYVEAASVNLNAPSFFSFNDRYSITMSASQLVGSSSLSVINAGWGTGSGVGNVSRSAGVFTLGTAGTYVCFCNCYWQTEGTGTSTTYRLLSFRSAATGSGVTYALVTMPSVQSGDPVLALNAMVVSNGSTPLVVEVWQNTGGARNVTASTYLMFQRVA
jgi:hypothetical protein